MRLLLTSPCAVVALQLSSAGHVPLRLGRSKGQGGMEDSSRDRGGEGRKKDFRSFGFRVDGSTMFHHESNQDMSHHLLMFSMLLFILVCRYTNICVLAPSSRVRCQKQRINPVMRRCLGAITSLGQRALAHVAPNIFARAFLQKCPGPCSLSPWNNSPTLLYFKAIGTLLPLEPHFSRLLSLPGHVHWPCHGNGFDSSHESSLEGGRLCQLPGALRNDWWLVDECSKEKS